MELKENVKESYELWICNHSWDSCHPLDNERFYRFVEDYMRYQHASDPIGGEELGNDIISRYKDATGLHARIEQDLDKKAEAFSLAFDHIRQFIKTVEERHGISFTSWTR